MRAVARLTPKRQRAFRAQFAELDRDGDGLITVGDVEAMWAKSGLDMTRPQAQQVLKERWARLAHGCDRVDYAHIAASPVIH